MSYAKYIEEILFEGQYRIEAGYCNAPVTLSSGSLIYPVNSAGCAMMARWCLRRADKATNKYERWQWQSNAAKWYQRAAGERD